jgi:tetratricopeptide (TPR) repeat protein
MNNCLRSFGIGLLVIGFGLVYQTSNAQKKKSKTHKHQPVDPNVILRLVLEGERQELISNDVKAASYYRECLNLDPANAVCNYKLAELYFKRYDFAGSEVLVSKSIQQDPSNEWYVMLLAQSQINQGKLEDAAFAFEKLIELRPEKSEYRFELANLFVQQGKFKEAIDILDSYEKQHGINPEVNMLKQNLYVQNGQMDKAIETCQVLVAQFPEESNYLGLLAELYMQDNQPEKALEAFHRLIEIDPGNGFAHISMATYYRHEGLQSDYERELMLAFQSIDLDVENKMNSLLPYLSDASLLNADWNFLERLLNELEIRHPNDARVYALISDFYYANGQVKRARDFTRKSLNIQKDKFQVWNQLIIMDSELQDWESMVIDAEQALELFPSNPAFYYYLGVSYAQLERYEEAIEILETGKMMIFDNEGGKVDFMSLLGDVYYSAGNPTKSANNYEKVLKIQPDNVYVLNNYSYYLSLQKKDLEKAMKMAKKAVELQPGQYNYEDTYGWVLFQAGEYEEALIWLQRAVDNGGHINGEIVEHLGDAFYKIGQIEKAIETWQKAKATGSASSRIDEKIAEQTLLETP